MQTHRSTGGKPAYETWHTRRQQARREAFSPEEFSAEDRAFYDLDNDDPVYPARIYGDENDRSFTVTTGAEGTDTHDIRETNPRI